jgi:hypothetical protein
VILKIDNISRIFCIGETMQDYIRKVVFLHFETFSPEIGLCVKKLNNGPSEYIVHGIGHISMLFEKCKIYLGDKMPLPSKKSLH